MIQEGTNNTIYNSGFIADVGNHNFNDKFVTLDNISMSQQLSINELACTSYSDYRYGFNQGSERDDEIKGAGNSYTTHFRQLDTRLGRWLSIDPVMQPWQSPYSSMDNNPIAYNDPLGNYVPTKVTKKAKRKEKIDSYGVPEKVQNTYNQEYGIKVKMEDGNLMYAGEYIKTIEKKTTLGGGYKTEEIYTTVIQEGPKVSSDAKALMMELLDPNKKADISYKFDSKKHDRGEINPFYTNLTVGSKNYRQSYFNLGAVNGDLSLKIVDNTLLKTADAKRSFNFGRVIEHESIHGLDKVQDYNPNSSQNWAFQFKTKTGPVVYKVNGFRRQMGLVNYQRLIYRNVETGNTILGNPKDKNSQFEINMSKNF